MLKGQLRKGLATSRLRGFDSVKKLSNLGDAVGEMLKVESRKKGEFRVASGERKVASFFGDTTLESSNLETCWRQVKFSEDTNYTNYTN